MSVGLLLVRLLYRFYVCVHLSKWFAFFSFLVVCSLLSGRPLHLLPTARICVVRDVKALHYQTATLFIKCFKVQIYQIAPHYVYLLLGFRALFSAVCPCVGQPYSLTSFGLRIGFLCDLAMCMVAKGWL